MAPSSASAGSRWSVASVAALAGAAHSDAAGAITTSAGDQSAEASPRAVSTSSPASSTTDASRTTPHAASSRPSVVRGHRDAPVSAGVARAPVSTPNDSVNTPPGPNCTRGGADSTAAVDDSAVRFGSAAIVPRSASRVARRLPRARALPRLFRLPRRAPPPLGLPQPGCSLFDPFVPCPHDIGRSLRPLAAINASEVSVALIRLPSTCAMWHAPAGTGWGLSRDPSYQARRSAPVIPPELSRRARSDEPFQSQIARRVLPATRSKVLLGLIAPHRATDTPTNLVHSIRSHTARQGSTHPTTRETTKKISVMYQTKP